MKPHAIIPLGDSAAFIEFGSTLDLHVNEAAQALAVNLRAQAMDWIVDVVPTLGGVALHFDLQHPQLPVSPMASMPALVDQCLARDHDGARPTPRSIEIPVCYEAEHGLDLDDIAAKVGLSRQEVIQRHASASYRVLMMGFVPGGPYMGGLDPSINLPRRTTPRTRVLQGSVALANLQVVIYPFTTPGGWHVVGRTPWRLFDPQRDPACLLSPRDQVRFVPITALEFEKIQTRLGQP
jgi:inhibitor of KinA